MPKKVLPKVIWIKLGERLRMIREGVGLSQESLADKCGLNRTAIGLIERGGRGPTLESLMRITRELDTTVTKLLVGLESWGILLPKKVRSRLKRRR